MVAPDGYLLLSEDGTRALCEPADQREMPSGGSLLDHR